MNCPWAFGEAEKCCPPPWDPPRTLSTTHSHRPVPTTLQPGCFWSTGSSSGHAKIKLERWVSKGLLLIPSWLHLSWTISPPMDTSSILNNGCHLALPDEKKRHQPGAKAAWPSDQRATGDLQISLTPPQDLLVGFPGARRGGRAGKSSEVLNILFSPPLPKKGTHLSFSICIIGSSQSSHPPACRE